VIVQGVEPTRPLGRQVVAEVPHVRGGDLGARAPDAHRARAAERGHAEPGGLARHVHRPAVGARGGVVVAMVHEDVDLELGRLRSVDEAIAHVRGAGAGLHPDAFLEPRVGHAERPHRRRALQVEALEQAVARGGDGAVRPAIDREVPRPAGVPEALVDLGHQQGAPQRRRQRGDEEPVVAAREEPGDGAGREAPDPVRAQPLARLGDVEPAADLAAPVEPGRRQHGPGHHAPPAG
jgi:hypothetical protein